MSEIKGAVFPIPHKLIERLLSKERDVFVKFGRFIHLSKYQKIVFYDSDAHLIIGEAHIEEVSYLHPTEVWKKYGYRLFLNKGEFTHYLTKTVFGSRTNKNGIMTVCILSNPVRYAYGTKLEKKMNLMGHYLR